MTIYKVHPVADLFPMLPDEELRELAEDIKENGLIFPIVLDGDQQLIDGRNRLRACELAGVEPAFTSLNGHDPIAYIISTNVNRRHLNKGQQAMAVAMAYPEPGEKGRGKKSTLNVDFAPTYLNNARTVLKYASDLAHEVIAGRLVLNVAYEEAQQRQKNANSEEGKLRQLDIEAPDLAVMVREEQLSLGEAFGALETRRVEAKKRKQEEAEHNTRKTRAFAEGVFAVNASVDSADPTSLILSWVPAANPYPSTFANFRTAWSPDGLRATAHRLLAFADAVEETGVEL